MGPFLGLLIVLALNGAPAGTSSVTIANFVLEGVGIVGEPANFRLDRVDEERWAMTNARGEPWIDVIVAGSTIRLLGSGFVDDPTDLTLMLGLPDTWLEDDTFTPPGADPLDLTRSPDGIDVRWGGPLAAQIRW